MKQAITARLGLLQPLGSGVAGNQETGDRPIAVAATDVPDRLDAGASGPQPVIGNDDVRGKIQFRQPVHRLDLAGRDHDLITPSLDHDLEPAENDGLVIDDDDETLVIVGLCALALTEEADVLLRVVADQWNVHAEHRPATGYRVDLDRMAEQG